MEWKGGEENYALAVQGWWYASLRGFSSVKCADGPLRMVILAMVAGVVSTGAVWWQVGGKDGEGERSAESRGAEVNRTTKDWGAADPSSTNVSHYVYRDLNRNGRYDEGDRPLAGVGVGVRRPDGDGILRMSNLRGFANFYNAVGDTSVEVYEEGPHQFEVLPPGGWDVTSGNERQTIDYARAPGTRPGIVAERTPTPVGLAPTLVVTGRVRARRRNGWVSRPDAFVEVAFPSGLRSSITVDSTGGFWVPATTGTIVVRARVEGRDGGEVSRSVEVGAVPVVLGSLVVGEMEGEEKEAVTLDFEDFGQYPIIKVPNGPLGLAWTNLIAVVNDLYGGPGYVNGTTSGRYVGYNTSGYPVEVRSDSVFSFLGAFFSAAWPEADGETLEVRAWRDERLVASDELEISSMGPVWFAAEYHEISRLQLRTEHYWQFVVDDFKMAH